MACRKEDIENYKHDINVLVEAFDIARKITDDQIVIGDDLTALQSEYSETARVTDEVVAEFHKLDQGAEESAENICSKIEKTIEELRSLLSDAEREESSCPVHNPRIGGLLDGKL